MLQQVPIGKQLFTVEFRPSFDEPLLPLGNASPDQFQRVDAVYGDVLLIVGMEVRGESCSAPLRRAAIARCGNEFQ